MMSDGPVNIYQDFGGIFCPHLQDLWIAGPKKTYFFKTTQRHIPGDSILRSSSGHKKPQIAPK